MRQQLVLIALILFIAAISFVLSVNVQKAESANGVVWGQLSK